MLFANSLLLDKEFNLLLPRDRFWDSSMYGYNPHNVGMFDIELTDIQELVEYIKGTSLFNVARNGVSIFILPQFLAKLFFDLEMVEGMVFDEEQKCFIPIQIHPEPSDLQYLRSYKFEDLTFRGTIEYRSACCQPIKECMDCGGVSCWFDERLDAWNSCSGKIAVFIKRASTFGTAKNAD